MVSPNLVLKLNISFNLIIGLIIIYTNNYKLITNLAGLFFIYMSINNIIILRQKSAPKLKKNVFKINSLFYCIICSLIILNIKRVNLSILILAFFALILNFIGYKITKI